ncbi:MAG: hypothetical protein ACOCSH_01785 [Candidatus Hadarchaeota archaeon]
MVNSTFQIDINPKKNSDLILKKFTNIRFDDINLEMEGWSALGENGFDIKKYRKIWKVTSSNIDTHSFRPTVEKAESSAIKYPNEENSNEPIIFRRPTELVDFQCSREQDYLIFSGTLRDKENQNGLAHKIVRIDIIEENTPKKLTEVRTDEKGYFKARVQEYKRTGVFRFEASFEGDNYFESTKSEPQYKTSLIDLNFILPSLAFLFLLIFGSLSFLNVKEKYPIWILVQAIILPVIFIIFLSRLYSGFVPGVFLGVLLEKNVKNWHIIPKIGAMGGILASASFGSLTITSILFLNRTIEVQTSYPPFAYVINQFIPTILLATIIITIGMVLGSLFGLLFKKLAVML